MRVMAASKSTLYSIARLSRVPEVGEVINFSLPYLNTGDEMLVVEDVLHTPTIATLRSMARPHGVCAWVEEDIRENGLPAALLKVRKVAG